MDEEPTTDEEPVIDTILRAVWVGGILAILGVAWLFLFSAGGAA